jgi:hypothetical protein
MFIECSQTNWHIHWVHYSCKHCVRQGITGTKGFCPKVTAVFWDSWHILQDLRLGVRVGVTFVGRERADFPPLGEWKLAFEYFLLSGRIHIWKHGGLQLNQGCLTMFYTLFCVFKSRIMTPFWKAWSTHVPRDIFWIIAIFKVPWNQILFTCWNVQLKII